jgi:hypothetical protein
MKVITTYIYLRAHPHVILCALLSCHLELTSILSFVFIIPLLIFECHKNDMPYIFH